MKGVEKAANFYCNVRIIVSSILGFLIGSFLLYWGVTYEKNVGDSSKFQSVIAKVKSGITNTSIQKNTTYYNNEYIVEYVVNNQLYRTQIPGNSFTNNTIAYSDIQNNIDREIQLFYDPNNPANTVRNINEENIPMTILIIIGLLLIAGAIVSFILRNNIFFCGGVIASDMISTVKSAIKS